VALSSRNRKVPGSRRCIRVYGVAVNSRAARCACALSGNSGSAGCAVPQLQSRGDQHPHGSRNRPLHLEPHPDGARAAHCLPIRDIKLVVAILLGPIVAALPWLATTLVVSPAQIEVPLLAPIVNGRVIRFVSSDPESQESSRNRMSVHTDLLVYRFKNPKRFELVAFSPLRTESDSARSGRGRLIMGPRVWFF